MASIFLKSKFWKLYSLIKWYQFLTMSNTYFSFTQHYARVSCLIIRLTNAITVTAVKGRRWRLLLCALRNFLLRNVMCFQKQPPLFLKVSQIPQWNTYVGVSFSLEMMKLYKDICSAWIKVDLHSANVSHTNDAFRWRMVFFISTFEANEIFFLLKACIRYFLSNFYFSPHKSPSKAMKIVFYFILKAFFVFKIFKFLCYRLPLFFSLSAIVSEVDPRKISKFMMSSIV